MEYSFDSLAEKYSYNIKSLPKEYIDMISSTFHLHFNAKVLDLGCGNGLLTFPIFKYTHNVEGLDISYNMIEIAKNRDRENRIKWIHEDVTKFEFPHMCYDLIITYESMHLFPNIQRVIEKASYGLKQGGYLCMGWCHYNWEFILEQDITDIFHNHGVIWGEWGYQKLNSFCEIINSTQNLPFTPPVEKHICIREIWSVKEVVEYITSISKVLTLDTNDICEIKTELMEHLLKKYGNRFYGNTQYWIRYTKKETKNVCQVNKVYV